LPCAFLGCGGRRTLSVQPGDFTLAAPARLSLPAGAVGSVPVTLARGCGFQGMVILSLAQAPPGVTYSGFIPAGLDQGLLVIQVEPAAQPGTFPAAQVDGTAGSLVHKASFELDITQALPPGQVRPDQVQATGGTSRGGAWVNHAVLQEPVQAAYARSPSGAIVVRHGFDPQTSLQP
jgi:hypothetical protein